MNNMTQIHNSNPVKGLLWIIVLSLTTLITYSQGHSIFSCSACHIFHNAPGETLTSVNGNGNLCISCHNPSGLASILPFDNSDKAIPGTGGRSHAWGVPAINVAYETNAPSDTEMLLRLPAGNIICSTCHDQHSSNTNPSYLRSLNTGDVLCKNCHSARDIGRYTDDNMNNKGSHPVGLGYPSGNSSYKETPTGSVQVVDGNIECSSCHQPHYSTTNDGNLLRQTNNDALCTECHTYSSHNDMGCNACHQTHNSSKDNIYMIRDLVATPVSGDWAVVYTAQSGPNSGADGDTSYDGICEVCHTSTNYHRNDGTGTSHNNESNCTSCHPHKDSFAPTGCEDCHIANFPNWGTADSHFAHTSKYTYACSTCHYQYGSGGDLEGTHPSGGSAMVNFDPNGMVFRNGADSNIPTYNGDQSCSNVYCHSDGQTAYRGTDGIITWGSAAPHIANYTNTPPWTSAVGTISTCDACHSGVGNMSGDYTITIPGPADPQPPNYGGHRRTPHQDNDDPNLAGNGWTVVNCFWCHNVSDGGIGSPILQGTYGTSYHVDGATHFDPRLFDNGGTMVNGTGYSYEGTHCGDGRKCW